jgi:hypothetical protein
MHRELDDQSTHIAASLQIEQEKTFADARLPELQKQASDIRVENAAKQELIEILAKTPGDSGQRRFEAVRAEKLGLLDEFQRQVDIAEAEAADLKCIIDHQALLIKADKLQVSQRGRAPKLDPRELEVEKRSTIARERAAQERLAVLHIELEWYAKKLAAIQEALANRNVGRMTRDAGLLKQKLAGKKRTFDEWVKNVKRPPVPITDEAEIERMRAELDGLDLQHSMTKKRRDLVVKRIKRSVAMLESWGTAIPHRCGKHRNNHVNK